MTRRKTEQANSQQSEQPEIQHAEQPEGQQAEQAEIQPGGDQLMRQLESAARPQRKRRPPAPPPDPLLLDPEFINSPQRMQYALLLALLLRQRNGSTTFTQKDLAHTDTDYNILFARTLDGRNLEVTVVSSESGIIRSPAKEREAEKWRTEQEQIELMTTTFQPLPPPSTTSLQNSVPRAREEAFLRAAGWNPGGGAVTGTENSLVHSPPGANPVGGFAIPQTPQQQTAEVIQLPKPSPTTPTDGSTSYHFPFQVGNNPQDATGGPTAMEVLHHHLMAKDQEVQTQEAEAIARQERGE